MYGAYMYMYGAYTCMCMYGAFICTCMAHAYMFMYGAYMYMLVYICISTFTDMVRTFTDTCTCNIHVCVYLVQAWYMYILMYPTPS